MKQLLTCFVLTPLFFATAMAQEPQKDMEYSVKITKDSVITEASQDTLVINLTKGRKLLFIENAESQPWDSVFKKLDETPKFKSTWSGFEMGVNSLVDANGNLDLKGKAAPLSTSRISARFRLNLIESHINLYRKQVGITYGAGLEWAKYNYSRNYTMMSNSDSVYFTQTPAGVAIDKNMLRVTYLDIPLMLQWNNHSKRKNSVAIAAGAILGIKLGAITKSLYSTPFQSDVKEKVRDDWNVQPFMVSGTFRVAYRGLRLFADVGLTPLFDKGKMDPVYPVSAGIALLAF